MADKKVGPYIFGLTFTPYSSLSPLRPAQGGRGICWTRCPALLLQVLGLRLLDPVPHGFEGLLAGVPLGEAPVGGAVVVPGRELDGAAGEALGIHLDAGQDAVQLLPAARP